MTGNDFPALRAAVRASVIGHAIASLTVAANRAASTASSARLIASRVRDLRGLSASDTIKTVAIALLTACIAIWGLSLLVPLYVSTAIPGNVFLLLGLLCAAAVASSNALADHWSRSRMRRVTAWLLGA